MPSGIFLRPLNEQDGPAFAGLSYSSADGGLIHYAANYQIDAYQAVQALHGALEGVAACAHDSSRLVGAGLVRFGKCKFEDTIYPFAMLGNLIVHPDYRGQGLAAQLVEWQIEKARERCGDEMVIVTNFQVGNRISHKIYNRWLNHATRDLLYLPLRAEPSAPPGLPGIVTGPLAEKEYELFAMRHNAFYSETNFYQPLTGPELHDLCHRSPLKTPIRHAYAAVDASGRLLAGLVALEEYRLKQMEVRAMPKSLEVINNVIGIIPRDGTVREIYLDHIWHEPGQFQAARQLIDTVRWIWAGRATTVAVLFDPAGPLRRVFSTYPWTVKAKTHMLFHAPKEMSPRKPVCPIF